MLKAAIIGGSGYTGYELLRILAAHPEVEVEVATSRQYAGEPVEGVFPSLAGFYRDLEFTEPGGFGDISADVAFCALPHGASQEAVPALLEGCGKVVDLSADFRLADRTTYTEWYDVEHRCPGLLDTAVYGLAELNRDAVKKARLVANPGCYPTGAILALAPLAPLIRSGEVDAGSVIIDSKSGVSGAGRGASLGTSFVEVEGGFKAYKVGGHRHTPEIEQELTAASGVPVSVTFTPHLLPVSRGILTTAYVTTRGSMTEEKLHRVYSECYAAERFVRVMAPGSYPDISQVRGSNYCDIGVYYDPGRGRVTAISAIDNLVKGASGQAVQNMNILFGLDETTGLLFPPISV